MKAPHIYFYKGFYGSVNIDSRTLYSTGELLFHTSTFSYESPVPGQLIEIFKSKVDQLLIDENISVGPFPQFTDLQWKMMRILYTYQSDEPYELDEEAPETVTVKQYHILEALYSKNHPLRDYVGKILHEATYISKHLFNV